MSVNSNPKTMPEMPVRPGQPPQMPQSSQRPTMPEMPMRSAQQAPGVQAPTMPQRPSQPSAQNQEMPAMPGRTVHVSADAAAPRHAAQPSMPVRPSGMNSRPQAPTMPQRPSQPSMPETPIRRTMPEVPNMNSRASSPAAGIPETPTRRTMPEMPKASSEQGITKTQVLRNVIEEVRQGEQSYQQSMKKDNVEAPAVKPMNTGKEAAPERRPVSRRKPVSNVNRANVTDQVFFENEEEVPHTPAASGGGNGSGNGNGPKRPKKSVGNGRGENTVNRELMPVWLMIVLTLVAVIANVLIIYTMFNASIFSTFSKKAFILINLVVMLVLVGVNYLLISALLSGKKVLYRAAMGVLAVMVFIGGYGSFAMTKVTTNVEKITATVVQESVSTSYVVYDENGNSPINDILQLEGKIVGYCEGTNTATLGQKQLKGSNVNASTESFQDYSAELLALFNGDIDCAILPTNYMSMFGNEASLKNLIANTKSIMDFEETVTVTNQSGADKDITREPFTVLLVGNADGLSDTMILCSVNPISLHVTMSSLARDSYVPIYGGGTSKLNSARMYGIETLVTTIENLVGVDIDYYVDVNFQGVVDIVDAVGGVIVNSPVEFVGQSSSEERGHYTVWVPAGENVVLNGEQALAFARERHLFSTGDFARQEHQQEVIEAIIQKIMRTRDVNTFLKVLDAAGNNIQTNFSVPQMTDFFRYVMQKANRFYDDEHIEDIFEIQTSRVTGYSSALWDPGLKLALYIYRVWNGSLADTARAINRNIDLDSFKTYDTSRCQWSINWDTELPIISYDVYPEPIIPADIPEDYEEEGCEVNQIKDSNGNCVCKAGYQMSGDKGCVAIDGLQTATPEPTEKPEETSKPIVTPDATPTPTPTPDNSCPAGFELGADGKTCVCIGAADGYVPDGTGGCYLPTSTPEQTPEPTETPDDDGGVPTPEPGDEG